MQRLGLPVIDALRSLPERVPNLEARFHGNDLLRSLRVRRRCHVHLRRPEDRAPDDAERIVLVAERRDAAAVRHERREPHPALVIEHHLAVAADRRRAQVPRLERQKLRRDVPRDPLPRRLVALQLRQLRSDADETRAFRHPALDCRPVLLVHHVQKVPAHHNHIELPVQLFLERDVHVAVLVGAELLDHRPGRGVLAERKTDGARLDVDALAQLHDLARLMDARDEQDARLAARVGLRELGVRRHEVAPERQLERLHLGGLRLLALRSVRVAWREGTLRLEHKLSAGVRLDSEPLHAFARNVRRERRGRVRRKEHHAAPHLPLSAGKMRLQLDVEHPLLHGVEPCRKPPVRHLQRRCDPVLHPIRLLDAEERKEGGWRGRRPARRNLHRLADHVRHHVVVPRKEQPRLGVVRPVELEYHRRHLLPVGRIPAADHIAVLHRAAARPNRDDPLRRRVVQPLVAAPMRRKPVHHPRLHHHVPHRRRLVVPVVTDLQRRRIARERHAPDHVKIGLAADAGKSELHRRLVAVGLLHLGLPLPPVAFAARAKLVQQQPAVR